MTNSNREDHDTGAWRPSPHNTKPGRTVGKYEIIELVGAGAMGAVFRARDPDLDREVAIKLMSPAVAQDEDQRGRFLREGRAAGSLQHPNIITIYGFGQSEQNLFIAMEFVEGRDLSDIIRNRVDISLQGKLNIIHGVLAGLQYAHNRGITHRDVKPSNIRLNKDGRPKIMDFGVAYFSESDLTGSGLVLGTPNYIAPEQVKGEEPTPAGDIFSIGAVLFELLTYEKPFPGETPHAVLWNVASDDPVSLDGLEDSVPESIRRVLKRSMQKDPLLRYRTAADMARDIRIARDAVGADNAEATIAVTPSPAPVRRRRNRLKPVAAGLAVVALSLLIDARAQTATATQPQVDTAAVSVSLMPEPEPEPPPAPAAPTPDTMLVSVRDAALAQRVQAEGAGVPADLLEPGDAYVVGGDSLAREGRYSEAILALSKAAAKWTEAESEHERRLAAARAARRRRNAARNTGPSRPASPPPTAQPASSASETPSNNVRLEIGSVVNRLAEALESRSIDRLETVYPKLTRRERETWQRFFRSARELTMTLDVRELQSRGDSARASVQGTYSYVTSTGQQRRPIEFPAVFVRDGGEWKLLHLGRTATEK